MNERLKEFFDFKGHTLKAIATLAILFILNIVFWVTLGSKLPFGISEFLILTFAILFFLYLYVLHTKNRAKGENINISILKNNLISLKYLALLYFVVFPLIATIYSLAKSIVDNINPQSYTFQIVFTIGATLVGIFFAYLILHLIFYVPTKLVQKEQESKGENQNEFVYFKSGTPEEIKLQVYNLKLEKSALSNEEQDKLMKSLKRKIKK